MAQTNEAASQRFHALDAVRAFALFLGIAGHATMSFFPIRSGRSGTSTRPDR
jgi:hypothetical protein